VGNKPSSKLCRRITEYCNGNVFKYHPLTTAVDRFMFAQRRCARDFRRMPMCDAYDICDRREVVMCNRTGFCSGQYCVLKCTIILKGTSKSRGCCKHFVKFNGYFSLDIYVIMRHENHCYGLTAAWLPQLGLNDAA
jgi:hypothetical protein